MRTIIHDLNSKQLKVLNFKDDDKLISAKKCSNHCVGCFSCWIKHPKHCVYKDDYSSITNLIKDSDELVIISKCRYGCYNSKVKMVLERCIGYVLPYFTIRDKRIHHQVRYNQELKFHVIFCGDMLEEDKVVATTLVRANAINLNSNKYTVEFCNNIVGINKCLL